MAPRFVKLPIVSAALVGGVLLLVTALAPVGAQQQGSIDGQVAVRSDGAVYLITNGQRRWVATVMISDDEINAYPEGEPIYTGLAPIGAAVTGSPQSAVPAPSPRVAAAPSPSAPSAGTPPSAAPAPGLASLPAGATGDVTPTAVSTPTGAVGEVDPLLPIEVDIDGSPNFEPGDRIDVSLKTNVGASCQLTVEWPDGTEVAQPGQTADSRGRCSYEIDVPASAVVGTGTLKGIVRESGRQSTQDVPFEVVPAA
jgi:hypothetical protein